MSQTNNNELYDLAPKKDEQSVEQIKEVYAPLKRRVINDPDEATFPERCVTFTDPNAPRILSKDSDLYISLCPIDKKTIIIKSNITEQIIPNRRYNKKSGYIEKIDLTIEEEDRRLIIIARDPKAVLMEDYYKSLGYGWI
jgi:hypothetical protein